MGDERKDTLRPTIVPLPSGRRKPTRAAKAAAAATTDQPTASRGGQVPPAPPAPTAIPGVERRRILVEGDKLRDLAPASGAATHALARHMIASVVAEKMTERKAILWGQDIQEDYSDAVSRTLSLSQDPLFAKVQGYVRRSMDILESIDVMAALGVAGGGLGGMFRGINSKIDTVDELAAARGELEQLMSLTRSSLDGLLELKDELERQSGRLDQAAVDAEAAAVAALFLADYFQGRHAGSARCFTDRAMSLTQTVAQIRSHSPLREMQIEHPIRMVGAIQNVTLVAMPDFLAGLATVTALSSRQREISPTEAGELNYKLRDIIGKLNS